MARKLIVELIADPKGYTRGLEKAAKDTKAFETEIGRVTRGVLSGSGAMEHFGRSIAFASGGFVAFAGASAFLRDSVDAARDAGVAQRSLAAQMQASGQSFTASKEAIDKAALSLEKYGFTSEESEKALTVLERGTGSISRAIGLQGVAANLARAKNIDLASAATVLAKVFGGQETALRRAVPGLEKHAHGLALIAEASAKLKGQMGAGATEAERFHAIIHNTDVIVGTALLPTLNKFLQTFGAWLEKMNESGRLQQDVNAAVKVATDVFGALKAVLDTVNTVTGSTANTVKVLFAAFVAFKTARFASTFIEIASSIGGIGGALGPLVGPAGLLAAAGAGFLYMEKSAISAAEAAQNAAASPLIQGSGLETILVPKLAQQIAQMKAGGQSSGAIITALRKQLGGSLKADDLIGEAFSYGSGSSPALQARIRRQIADRAGVVVKTAQDEVAKAVRKGATMSQQYTWFDQMISRDLTRVQDIPTLQGQIGRLQQIAGLIGKRLAATKDITRRLTLEDQLLAVQRTIRGDQAQISQNAQAAAQASKDRAAAAQQALFDRLQFNVDKTGLTASQSDDLKALQAYKSVLEKTIATQGSNLELQKTLLGVETSIQSVQAQISQNRRDTAQKAAQDAQQAATAAATRRDTLQFRLLGLGPTGGALVPGVANLTKRLAGIKQAVAGTFLDTKQTGAELAHIGKILAGQFGTVSDTVRAAIDQMYNDIRDKLKGHTGDQTKFTHMSSQKFVESLGLNLTGAQKRAIESRFATVGAGGMVATGSHQIGSGVVITGDVHVHGVHDIKGFENEIVKRAKARPHTRRGA